MDNQAQIVRQRSPAAPPDAGDRRVRRTRVALTNALVELVLKKRYAAITIQDLLDRADVGRSTFYAHYRGKDDLLLGSFQHMLRALDASVERDPPGRRRVAPVRELFAHVGEFRRFLRAVAQARMLDRLFQAGTELMAASIATRITPPRPRMGIPAVPPLVVAHGWAGTLFALLRWWLENDTPYTPDQMDALYHAMVLGQDAP
jgi:AcrR family transcriptional regulator